MKILKDIDAETDIVLKLDDPSSVLKQGEGESNNVTKSSSSVSTKIGGFESVYKGVIKRLEHPFDNFRVDVKRCKRGPKTKHRGYRYDVRTGRRDGVVSLTGETTGLPPSTFNLNQLTQMFESNGLTQDSHTQNTISLS
ncbi:peroxidase 5 [Tanacetum coccineum]